MLVVSMLRILFDVGILSMFVSMSNPRQDGHNPFCLMLQYTAFPFAARLFPDLVTMGAINVHQKNAVDMEKLFVKDVSGPKAVLPLRLDDIDAVKNATTIESFLVMRDSTFKYFLNMSILAFMYLGTLLTWAAVRKAQLGYDQVDMGKMRKIYSILLYFCVCTVWICCNTDSMRKMWKDTMENRYGSAFMINFLAWSFLAVTIRVTYHCVQLIPPQTSSQCNFLQNYLAILNISVWYSFVALYFAYNFYKPTPFFHHLPLAAVPFDENLLVSLLFLFSFLFAPPYRYRLPIPLFSLMRNLGGSLPEMQERFHSRERAAKRTRVAERGEECVELKMDSASGMSEAPPAYEAA